ncbi:helix-turn-helix transcriptional regulator [Paenibacillus allorhizosphaerae]|uniref:YafY family transcriptional regulator n=1 Tax=Paenibacillus allorhizosphaerae TaxID=2849866 RepID=A0ABM8VRU3_9BACL|nr:YafY family protein [Paenibacillus allorhizosphaerae]CAG7655784.1 hypothetical protein PAECIP111802_06206 [Paenibacillus allorhizosphaerae]
MNKTDRMLAIVLELQRKGTLRAEDLAVTFETSVRTIYRDVQALSEAGVPVIGAPGQGYSLMDGYFLPPVSFLPEEAVTLLLGADMVEQQFDEDYRSKAKAARAKLESVLPGTVLQEAARVRSGLRMLNPGRNVTDPEKRKLTLLRLAVLEERQVRFRYVKGSAAPEEGGGITRIASPYGLVLVSGVWHIIAFCELRQDLRHFRLSRMSGLELLDSRFARPDDFNLEQYAPPDDRNCIIRVRFPAGFAAKIEENRSYYIHMIETTDEACYVTLRVRQLTDVLPWVLGWGSHAVVLEPEAMRTRIRQEIERMLLSY